MDDLSASLLDLIFEAESKGLIKIKDPGEGKGQGRAMLMDHINGSAWLKTRMGQPLPAARRAVRLAELVEFRDHLLDDPYRDADNDPIIHAITHRIVMIQNGNA